MVTSRLEADQAIKVQRLTVRNFRCFRDLSLNVEGLCSLVGENGSGKTTILEALFFVLAPYTGPARFTEQDFNNDDAGPIEIEAQFSRCFVAKLPDGYTQQAVECKGVGLKVKRREKAGAGKALNDPFTIEHWVVPDEARYGSGPQWKLRRKNGSDFQFSPRSLAIGSVDLEGYPSVHYFAKTRERQAAGGYNSTFQRMLDEIGWRYRKGLEGREDEIRTAWEQYYQAVLDCVDEKKRRSLLDAFRARSEDLLGDCCDDVELALLRVEEPFAKGFLARRDGLNQIDLGGMGSGVSMVMTLALLETVATLDKADLIVLVDEPEMHLHPQLQVRLRENLARGNYQVVYSTHSPLMVNLGEWRSVKRFDRCANVHPGAEVLNEDLPQDGRAKSLEAHLDEIGDLKQHVSLLMRENNELLFARACVLVEGPLDKYAIEVLGSVCRAQLDQLTVIPCHGKSKIPYYQILCRAFGIPFFTVYDMDSGDSTTNNRVRDFASEGWLFEFDPSLEGSLGVANGGRKGTRTIRDIDERAGKRDVPGTVQRLLEKLTDFQRSLQSQPAGPEGTVVGGSGLGKGATV